MKQFILIVCLSAALISCGESETKTDESTSKMSDSSAATTNTATNDAPSPVLPDSVIQRNWGIYATPGEPHAMMAKWNGTWTGKMAMRMKPDAPADTSMATAVNKMIYGGRYQQSTHIGDMGGMKFEGQSIMGYDNAKKVFQSTWMDNMGTGIMMMEGPWDEASKTITMTGKMVDAGSGTGKEVTLRHVIKIIDDNHHIYEMFCTGPDGKEFQSMHIDMSKK